MKNSLSALVCLMPSKPSHPPVEDPVAVWTAAVTAAGVPPADVTLLWAYKADFFVPLTGQNGSVTGYAAKGVALVTRFFPNPALTPEGRVDKQAEWMSNVRKIAEAAAGNALKFDVEFYTTEVVANFGLATPAPAPTRPTEGSVVFRSGTRRFAYDDVLSAWRPAGVGATPVSVDCRTETLAALTAGAVAHTATLTLRRHPSVLPEEWYDTVLRAAERASDALASPVRVSFNDSPRTLDYAPPARRDAAPAAPTGPLDAKYGRVTTEKGSFHPNEPVFLVRASDPLGAYLVNAYYLAARLLGCAKPFLLDVGRVLSDFRNWAAGNADKMKSRPD